VKWEYSLVDFVCSGLHHSRCFITHTSQKSLPLHWRCQQSQICVRLPELQTLQRLDFLQETAVCVYLPLKSEHLLQSASGFRICFVQFKFNRKHENINGKVFNQTWYLYIKLVDFKKHNFNSRDILQ